MLCPLICMCILHTLLGPSMASSWPSSQAASSFFNMLQLVYRSPDPRLHPPTPPGHGKQQHMHQCLACHQQCAAIQIKPCERRCRLLTSTRMSLRDPSQSCWSCLAALNLHSAGHTSRAAHLSGFMKVPLAALHCMACHAMLPGSQ